MADIIKTVTDKNQFQFLLDNFFEGKNVFIKTSNGSINLQFLGYSDGNVAFRIPFVKSVSDQVVVFVRQNANTIYLSMKFIERSEDTFIFIPLKFQIISEYRKEDRKLVGIEGGKNILYIDNIVTDLILVRALSTADKKTDKIKEIAEFELKKKFENVKIVFIHETKKDTRLKHVVATAKSIFVSNLNVDPEPEREEEFNYYINNIYKSDFAVSSRNRYISEVTIPVMFNNIIPYGYLQVNSSSVITDGLFEVVKRMAIVIDQLLKKNNLFMPIDSKFLISDMSNSGLGFVFKEKKYIRYFQEGGKISFTIMLPTMKKAVIGAIVRNITFMENRIMKIGCEINIMDNTSRMNYEEFIDSTK